MSTSTTETSEPLAWNTEFGRLYAVEKQLRDKMALLTPTIELMIMYEKLYILASDNTMHHCIPDAVAYCNYFRKYANSRPQIAPIGGEDPTRAFYDWDEYFLGRKSENYLVSNYFNMGEIIIA